MVDSPSATDEVAKDQMLKSLNSSRIKLIYILGLNALSILPHQIHVAVTTHGHPGKIDNLIDQIL